MIPANLHRCGGLQDQMKTVFDFFKVHRNIQAESELTKNKQSVICATFPAISRVLSQIPSTENIL